jgi:hypothetical protein
MKSIVFAAVTLMILGFSVAAFAQGVPGGTVEQHYGAAWAASQARGR